MLYSEFLRYSEHLVKISDQIHDGWVLKTKDDYTYLTKTLTQCLDNNSDLPDLPDLNDLEESNIESDIQSATKSLINVRKWEYHVLYSISYEVPVLFFNVWNSAGQLLSLDELWHAVHPSLKSQIYENRWYTLTQQEHPYLHQPFFFFHPCNTSAFINCFSDKRRNILITWLSSVGAAIWLYMHETYGIMSDLGSGDL